jgi:hypothetical protein
MIPTDKKIGRKIFSIIVYIFAIIGFVFAGVFIAMQFNLLNVKGAISVRNSYFNFKKTQTIPDENSSDLVIICKINLLGKYAPFTSVNIYKTLVNNHDTGLINQMITVASKRFEADASYIESMKACANTGYQAVTLPISAYNWADTDQWNLMREVFTRDQDIIKKAAADAHISSRVLLGGVIGEQFRFFNNRREAFKSYFEPLKILASLSQVSYGIAGIKPKTAGQIEEHLKDRTSPFYLGPDMEHILDYPIGADVESERLSRITDVSNPYYSYLYVGLYLKQVEAQWSSKGYDISNRPEILSTLYNLGFYYSVPNPDPKTGGTLININGVDYTFGDLGYEFYYSGELSDIFPLGVQ